MRREVMMLLRVRLHSTKGKPRQDVCLSSMVDLIIGVLEEYDLGYTSELTIDFHITRSGISEEEWNYSEQDFLTEDSHPGIRDNITCLLDELGIEYKLTITEEE